MARNDNSIKLNLQEQNYKGIRIRLINRVYKKGLNEMKAKRYLLIPPTTSLYNMDNQNVWIPNKHLMPDGTLKPGEDIDYVFRKAQNQLNYAGYRGPIIGIKRALKEHVEEQKTWLSDKELNDLFPRQED